MRTQKAVLISLFLSAFLTSCASETVIPEPVVIETTKREFVKVPPDLLKRGTKSVIPEGDVPYSKALELWADDRATIDTQNGQFEGIEIMMQEEPDAEEETE